MVVVFNEYALPLWVLLTVIGALGVCVGSFLNVVIYRFNRPMTVTHPSRSFCPACKETLRWYDNVPLISYILLRGKCRFCKSRIPVRYPAIELITALVFMCSAYGAFRVLEMLAQ